MRLLKEMILEEWRSHSTMFGGRLFAFFPLMIFVFSFAAGIAIPYIVLIMPLRQLIMITFLGFFLMGFSVGSFGLLGREVMNRRLGHASLVAFSSRSLPIGDREIFLNFFIKDTIYYLGFWVMPFCIGAACSFIFAPAGLMIAAFMTISIGASFLFGLSLSFLLSTLYVHSKPVSVIMILAIIAALLAMNEYYNIPSQYLLLPYLFFLTKNIFWLLLSVAFIIAASAVSIFFLKVEFNEKKRIYANSFVRLSELLGFSRYSDFISKDLLDLQRSEGGMSKIIFSYAIPLTLGWFIISQILKFLPEVNKLLLFALYLGLITSSTYSWLTEFDLHTTYVFLPLDMADIIRSKLLSFAVLSLLAPAIFILIAVTAGRLDFLFQGLCALVSITVFMIAVTVYLTGVFPNVFMYNPKTFIAYLSMILPLVLAIMILSFVNPNLLFLSMLSVFPSYFLIRKSYAKWNRFEA